MISWRRRVQHPLPPFISVNVKLSCTRKFKNTTNALFWSFYISIQNHLSCLLRFCQRLQENNPHFLLLPDRVQSSRKHQKFGWLDPLECRTAASWGCFGLFLSRNSIVAQENMSIQAHTSRGRFVSRFCGLIILQLLQQSPLTLSRWANECVLTLLAGQALEER